MSEPAASPPSFDPAVVIRSRAYISALVLAAVLGVPISVIAYGFLALVAVVQQYVFVGLPESSPRGSRSCLVAGSLVGAVWAVDGVDHPVSAGNRGPLTGFRLQDGRRSAQRPGARGHYSRGTDHAQPGCGARAGGSADRDRWRPRGVGGAPGEEGRSADGPDDHGVGRQLRSDQYPARIPRARCIPDHGGRRDRGNDAEPDGPARTARFRRRGAGVRRLGRLDRAGQLLAGAARRCRLRCRRPWRRWAGR